MESPPLALSAAISSTSWLTAFSIESRYAWFIVLLLCEGSSMTRLTIPSAFSYRTASVVEVVIRFDSPE
jgi:hypothetical protein